MENETNTIGTAAETTAEKPAPEQSVSAEAAVSNPAEAAAPEIPAEVPAEPVGKQEEPAAGTGAEKSPEPVEAVKSEEAVEAAEPVSKEVPAEGTKDEERPVREHFERRERPVIPITQDMIDNSRLALVKMLDYLGLEGSVKAEGHVTKINLYVSSNDAGRIIGRKGQTLESLQLILNKMMQKTNLDFPKVYIDLDGYSSNRADRKDRPSRGDRPERGERPAGYERDEHGERGEYGERGSRDDRGGRPPRRSAERAPRRENTAPEDGFSDDDDKLRQQAVDASKEVRRWGEPVKLPPMNSHDRRIIHITLENETDLITESAGDGALKSVTISLKK